MKKENQSIFQGRGAQLNPKNRFEKSNYDHTNEDDIDIDFYAEGQKTKYIKIHPKTIVNKVPSPDVPMEYSLNPYQGCEHGCTYCYARPTHEYWGYSAGLDFESVIMVKENAPELLRQTLMKKSWKVHPIVFSGNTDCYQPCEKKFGITRKLLEVMLECKHPVGIITKNVLIKRDFDIVKELAKLNLIHVHLSITTLNEELRRSLEPRTATSKRKLELVKELSDINVPVTVMAAPIIPGLSDHEILPIAKASAEMGAKQFHTHVVRLMGPNAALFENWLDLHYPNYKSKVMNQIKDIHGGKTGNSNFGDRMKGQGNYSNNISQQRKLARAKYFPEEFKSNLNQELFVRPSKNGQLNLF